MQCAPLLRCALPHNPLYTNTHTHTYTHTNTRTHLHAEVAGNEFSSGDDGNILQQGLAALAKARGLHVASWDVCLDAVAKRALANLTSLPFLNQKGLAALAKARGLRIASSH